MTTEAEGRYIHEPPVPVQGTAYECGGCGAIYFARSAAVYCCARACYCEDCGKPTKQKYYLKCDGCRDLATRRKWEAMPLVEWDEQTPICCYNSDEYFFHVEDLCDWLADLGMDEDTPMLVLCQPNYARVPDLAEYVGDDSEIETEPCDYMPNGWEELQAKLHEMFDKHIVSWSPGKTRIDVSVMLAEIRKEQMDDDTEPTT